MFEIVYHSLERKNEKERENVVDVAGSDSGSTRGGGAAGEGDSERPSE